MTTNHGNGKLWASMALLIGAGIPAIVIRVAGIHLSPQVDALIYGIGIVGGAFLLSWAAEIAQMDVSASLAIAVLALVAVLPEYTIEAVLALNAGASFDLATREVTEEISLVAANVTGANRLLIGFGWAAVILIFWLKRRRNLDMRGLLTLELPVLALATVLLLVIFVTQTVPMLLAIVLIGLYIFYLWRSSIKEAEEPDLLGAAAMIASFKPTHRRMWVSFFFLYSATIIVLAAEPFVHGLVDTGRAVGISEFLLIQWLAPLASESPEIITAVLFSLRANPNDGLTALISSQTNQLTLLIGSTVIIFSISAGQILNFPLNTLQSNEFLLTAATSIFAIILISGRIIKAWHGLILIGTFAAYLLTLLLFYGNDIENTDLRLYFSYIMFALTAGLLALNWRRVLYVLRGVPAEDGAREGSAA